MKEWMEDGWMEKVSLREGVCVFSFRPVWAAKFGRVEGTIIATLGGKTLGWQIGD